MTSAGDLPTLNIKLENLTAHTDADVGEFARVGEISFSYLSTF